MREYCDVYLFFCLIHGWYKFQGTGIRKLRLTYTVTVSFFEYSVYPHKLIRVILFMMCFKSKNVKEE